MIKKYKKTAEETKWSKKEEYDLIEISNNKNLTITFCTCGASIYTIYFKNKMITFTPIDDFTHFCFNGLHYGKTLGRTAGRVKNGIAIIDGKEYKLEKFGDHTLHGCIGFQFKKYDLDIKENEDEYTLIFKMVSEDGDQGYPGELTNYVIYHFFKNEDILRINYQASTSKDTLCNLSNHVYWNLEGDMKKNIADEYLKINATDYVEIDDDLIYKCTNPLNELHDFRKERKIEEHLFAKELQETFYKGYDHDYYLNKKEDIVATLSSSDHSMHIDFKTSYPVCHLFTANCFSEEYRYHAVALEFQKEIFHQEKVILRKDEKYDEWIEFNFR